MAYTLVPTELIVDGAVTSAKLDTNISISGTLGVTGELTLSTHMIMGDNDKIKIGTGGDLEIYHDGSNSYISNSTGNIYLADTNGSVHIQAKLNEESIVCAADGAVTLYHDNASKLATSSSGIDVTGTVVADGLTVDGDAFISSANARLRLFETDTTDLNTQFQNQAGDFFIKTIPDDASSSTSRFGIDHSTGDISFYEDTGTTAKFFWDASAESLGIGGSPDTQLNIKNGDDAVVRIESIGSESGDDARLELKTTNGTFTIQNDRSLGTSGALTFAGNTSNNIVIDHNSGNVGIGTNAPDHDLHIETTDPTLILAQSGSINNANSGRILFAESPSYTTTNSHFEIKYDGLENHLYFGSPIDGSTDLFVVGRDGNVGIGTSSPGGYYSGAEQLVVAKASGEAGITIATASDTNGALYFADGTTGAEAYQGGIGYQHDTSKLFLVESGVATCFFGPTEYVFNEPGVDRDFRVESNNVGHMLYIDGGNDKVGIGTNVPDARLQITNAADLSEAASHLRIEGAGYSGFHWLNGTAYYIGQNSNGRQLRMYSGSNEGVGVYLGNGANSWASYSDERLKENIQDIGSVTEKIKDIRCVTYNRKDVDDENKHDTIGFIAQDFVGKFDQVLDESKVLDTDEETRYSIRYTETIPILMKAIQEQQTIIDDLKSRIETLENE